MRSKKMAKILFVLTLTFFTLSISKARLEASETPQPQEKVMFDESIAKLSQDSAFCSFTPPKGWTNVPRNTLPPEAQSDFVRVHVKGKGAPVPPTVVLAVEKTTVDLRTYLQNCIEDHEAHVDSTCKKLGSIQTASGPASLLQVDRLTKWGEMRMLQSVILLDDTAYVMTATALQEEFPQYYKEFFGAIQSIKIREGLFTKVQDPDLRDKIEFNYQKMKDAWRNAFATIEENNGFLSRQELAEKTFQNKEFQSSFWNPFVSMLDEDLAEIREDQHDTLITNLREELLWIR
jgi:hypothetical protein